MQRVCQSCSRYAVYFSKLKRQHRLQQPLIVARLQTSEPLPPPSLQEDTKVYPEKIHKIVNDIAQLTLLETSQLNELLKATLKIPDAPMMAMGSMPMQSVSAADAPSEEKKEEEPTTVTVKLVKFADNSKIKLIKEIKALIEGMNLVQAKKFVESAPQVVKEDVSKEEAEKLKAALEAAGGTVEFE